MAGNEFRAVKTTHETFEVQASSWGFWFLDWWWRAWHTISTHATEAQATAEAQRQYTDQSKKAPKKVRSVVWPVDCGW